MDCIIFIFAVVYLIKRPNIVAKQAEDYPNVPPATFAEWKRLELLNRDIVIWIGFGWITVEIIGAVIMGRYVFALAAIGIPILLITLVIAAVIGSKAAKIRKANHITF